MSQDNLLIVADSARCADLRYAVGLCVPAPFIYLRVNGRGYAVLGDEELDRVGRQGRKCRVLSLSRCQRQLRRAGEKHPGLAAVIRLLVGRKDAGRLLVPADFPLGLARELRHLKVRVRPRTGELFFPEREFKSAEELEMIRAAVVMAEVGLAEAIQALKDSKIGPREQLIYHGSPLTAEKLRGIIQVAILQAGGQASRTTVAGGRQGCDLYEIGSGPLPAHRPITLQVFPRSEKTGYYANIARTVVRGRASEPVRKLYAAVKDAQEIALDRLRDGARAREVHATVQDHFVREGFRTSRAKGAQRGFLYATGHGLGLAPSEPPHLTATSDEVLRPSQVVALHPSLHYPEFGGVRVGDVAVVTRNGARNLTQFEKILEV